MSLLRQCILSNQTLVSILDLDPGNGIVAEELRAQFGTSISGLVRTDLFQDAKDAVQRDYPDVYNQYIFGDCFTDEA